MYACAMSSLLLPLYVVWLNKITFNIHLLGIKISLLFRIALMLSWKWKYPFRVDCHCPVLCMQLSAKSVQFAPWQSIFTSTDLCTLVIVTKALYFIVWNTLGYYYEVYICKRPSMHGISRLHAQYMHAAHDIKFLFWLLCVGSIDQKD